MKPLAGVYDPRGLGDSVTRLARVSGLTTEVVQIGALTVACADPPGRAGAVTCFLNGELYEAEEVAARLGLPRDTAPTRTIATGYARDGEAFLASLRGSYHLVLYDDARGEAVISQDHLSSRAVFYRSDGPRVTFASEIAPLLASLQQRPAPDPDTVPRWITDRSLPHGLTLYEGVRRLQAGWTLLSDRSGPRLLRTWEPRYQPSEPLASPEAEALVRQGLDRAVRRRLDPAGRTGILLSGGFDSGALSATAAPILRERGFSLPAYSTIFPDEPWDESPWVQILTEELGLPSTRVRTRRGSLWTALRFQQHFEVPHPAPGAILDQPLTELAHQDGIRVVFDGQGGDELFAASMFRLTDYAMRGRFLAAWRLAHEFPGVTGRLPRWQAQWILKQIVLRGAIPYSAHRIGARIKASPYASLEWLTPRSRRVAAAFEDEWAWKRDTRGKPRWWAHLAFLLVEARELVGLQDILRRRGELCGVESREPLLLDVDLVELMLRMPNELSFSRHYDRALARNAMRGIVPEPVRLPIRKSNYAPLMHRTLSEEDFEEIRRVLSQPDAEVGAFADLNLIRHTFLGRPPAFGDPGWAEWGQYTWALATTELWLRANALGDGFSDWASELRLEPPQVEVLARPQFVAKD